MKLQLDNEYYSTSNDLAKGLVWCGLVCVV